MRLKYLAIGIMMLFCLNVFGQQEQTAPMTVQLQKTEVQVLEETVSQLQVENVKLNNELLEVKKTNVDNMDKIKEYSEQTHTDLSHWFSWLALLITFVSIACPVIVNLSYKKYYFDKQVNILQEDIKTIKDNLQSAKDDANSAKKSLSEITGLKEDIAAIKKDIDKSKKSAERSAKRAMTTKYFTQALYEKDKLKAVELYTKVIDIDANNETAYFNRANQKQQMGDNKGAIDDYTSALILNPNDIEAYCNRGISKSIMGDTQGAMDDYDKAKELDTKNVLIYNNRANIYLKNNQISEAVQEINIAIAIDNNNPDVLETRGEIHMANGDFSKAEEDFNLVIIKNKENKGAYEKRAECYRKMADKEKDPSIKACYSAMAATDEEKAKSLGDK